jgi:thiamine pyrophosphate-dependent acetolactate synthase large subunit-like protein
LLPSDTLLRQAADVLNAGKKVAMWIGAGALGAMDEVIAVAEKLQAGVAKALLGKAVLPDDLPWVTGWSDPRLIVMVLNNRDLNQVTWEEQIQLGDGKTESTQSITDFPYHKYAELMGLKGIFVSDPDKLGAAWDEAPSADRPVILECYTDPNAPPLPPHITLKDASEQGRMAEDGRTRKALIFY